jgi:hypothetical protein
LLKPFLQGLRLAHQLLRPLHLAEQGRQFRGAAFRRIDIPLHFAQRDGSVRHRPIGMKHRIPGILPPLLHQPFKRVSSVFDEAIAIDIAVPVDPPQGQLDVGPDGLDQREISRALVVGRRQDDEERGGIHRAVIVPERDFAERREFP